MFINKHTLLCFIKKIQKRYQKHTMDQNRKVGSKINIVNSRGATNPNFKITSSIMFYLLHAFLFILRIFSSFTFVKGGRSQNKDLRHKTAEHQPAQKQIAYKPQRLWIKCKI